MEEFVPGESGDGSDFLYCIFDTMEKAKAYMKTIDVKSYIAYEPKAEETRTETEIKVYNGIGDIYYWRVKEMEVQ